MLQLLHILILTLTLSLTGQREQAACPATYAVQGAAHVMHGEAHAVHEDSYGTEERPVAILSNPQHNCRLGSSRPQRIQPVQASKQKRHTPTTPRTAKHRQPSIRHYGGRNALLSASFQAAVSREYFIIALRRIIR